MPKPRPKKPAAKRDTTICRFPLTPKRPEPTGAIVTGTDPCTCGHAPEDHGREPAFPSSTECRECEDGDGGPGCIAYEADPEAA